jgi:DNA-binding PadR family transcriptional regulator
MCFYHIVATHKEFRKAWILLLLRKRESYGYELRRGLRGRGLRLDSAVMYRSLRDMELAGLISSRWMHSDGGPRRHVYDLTPAGRKELARVAREIEDARDAQSAFLAEFRSR